MDLSCYDIQKNVFCDIEFRKIKKNQLLFKVYFDPFSKIKGSQIKREQFILNIMQSFLSLTDKGVKKNKKHSSHCFY